MDPIDRDTNDWNIIRIPVVFLGYGRLGPGPKRLGPNRPGPKRPLTCSHPGRLGPSRFEWDFECGSGWVLSGFLSVVFGWVLSGVLSGFLSFERGFERGFEWVYEWVLG